jgi:hypothetical protein
MGRYRFREYFEKQVLRKRPYIKKEFWAQVPDLEGRYLRVVTLADKVTIHNAFPDRRFKP